jgi:4-hydroxybenzoate polyprenyltransferase
MAEARSIKALGAAGVRSQDIASALLAAIRPHQWLKNLLILVPAVAAHRLDARTISSLLVAFVSFSLVASAGYVLNDLLDVKADRQHARKRRRPFASRRLSVPTGVGLLAGLWAIGFSLAAVVLPGPFMLMLVAYLATTVAYSVRLKREAVLDVMILAGVYVLRVLAGGVATVIPVSTWLLAFTLFMSLSLAFLKRFIEVKSHSATGGPVPGRGYAPDDAAWLHAVGLSSAYLGVLVLALYANNIDVTRLYSQPDRLLLACPPLLYWTTRIWFKAHRGELHDDPVVAVALDPVTYLVVAISAASVYAAV